MSSDLIIDLIAKAEKSKLPGHLKKSYVIKKAVERTDLDPETIEAIIDTVIYALNSPEIRSLFAETAGCLKTFLKKTCLSTAS